MPFAKRCVIIFLQDQIRLQKLSSSAEIPFEDVLARAVEGFVSTNSGVE